MRRSVKQGVRLRGLSPAMLAGDAVVAGVFEELGAKELVITSATDGDHMAGSKHHCGDALDYRRRVLPDAVWSKAVDFLRARLGHDFDVVLEDSHLHVEYDPK